MEFANAGQLLEAKELIYVERLCGLLGDKANYWATKLTVTESDLLDKLLTFPLDKVFPCLDLYRIFLFHPDSSIHYKKFEDGLGHLYKFMGFLE